MDRIRIQQLRAESEKNIEACDAYDAYIRDFGCPDIAEDFASWCGEQHLNCYKSDSKDYWDLMRQLAGSDAWKDYLNCEGCMSFKVMVVTYGAEDYEALEFEKLGEEGIQKEFEENLFYIAGYQYAGDYNLKLVYQTEVDDQGAAEKLAKAVLATAGETGIGDYDSLKNKGVMVVVSRASHVIYGNWNNS